MDITGSAKQMFKLLLGMSSSLSLSLIESESLSPTLEVGDDDDDNQQDALSTREHVLVWTISSHKIVSHAKKMPRYFKTYKFYRWRFRLDVTRESEVEVGVLNVRSR